MRFWDKLLGQNRIKKSEGEGEGMADNLILKGATWHVHLELPEDLRLAFGYRTKLTKSLKNGRSKNESNTATSPPVKLPIRNNYILIHR